MEGREVYWRAKQYFKKNYPNIIRRALEKISKLEANENKPIGDPKRGHHVINKGVNDLYIDIIMNCLVKIGGNDKYNIKIIDKTGLLNHNSVARSIDIPEDIKSRIDSMKVHRPKEGGPYNSKNDLQFGCAKIILLACVHCVMQDIFNSLLRGDGIPENLKDTLKNLSIIIAYDFIKTNGHGVYVDVKAKKWWDDENPDKAQVFLECKESVDTFLTKIADNSHWILTFGEWVHKIVNGWKLDKSILSNISSNERS